MPCSVSEVLDATHPCEVQVQEGNTAGPDTGSLHPKLAAEVSIKARCRSRTDAEPLDAAIGLAAVDRSHKHDLGRAYVS
jgi:hypothetical protein